MFFESGIIWSDVNGFTSLLTLNTNLNNIGAMLFAMEACSNGDWSRTWTGPVGIQPPTLVNAVYNSILDRAVLSMQTASGSIAKLQIPAPKLSCFMADRQTIDVTNPAIAALIAQAIADMTDNAGNPLVSSSGGFYQRTGKALTGGS